MTPLNEGYYLCKWNEETGEGVIIRPLPNNYDKGSDILTETCNANPGECYAMVTVYPVISMTTTIPDG